MVPKVVGSNPIFHPNKTNEARRCRKATSFCFLTMRYTNSFVERSGRKQKRLIYQLLAECSVVRKCPCGEQRGKTSEAMSIPSTLNFLQVTQNLLAECCAVRKCPCGEQRGKTSEAMSIPSKRPLQQKEMPREASLRFLSYPI